VKSRSLGIVFVAAVILPSILLAVLSIRSAGREEAFVERQLAAALDLETTRAAGLANAEVARVVEELRAGIDVPAGNSYGSLLRKWKAGNPLVEVPFLLSPRFGVLWPITTSGSGAAEKRFLRDQGDFLSDRTATTILQNIADRYQREILAQAAPAALAPVLAAEKDGSLAKARAAPAPAAEAPAETSAVAAAAPAATPAPADAAAPATAAAAPASAGALAAAATEAEALPSVNRQKALDAFAQSPAIQTEVYAAAAVKGDQLSDRVAQPVSPNQAAVRQEQPSQYVVTSQLLSQIASAGDAGIIPRFGAGGLAFLFWERQADGRIAGCEIAGSLFRARIASVLDGTTTASRILTFLDENGTPLAAPPGLAGRDWRRPFVSREIGAALPRWEAAAYLTRPDAISSQARASSLVIWIMVLILFVSVAGGGTMVLSSVYGEMRLAQKKATFVTNVSHELKTPLTSISLFIELLRKKRPVSAAKRESYLAYMASETERLTRLINNVLDFSATGGAGREGRAGRAGAPRKGRRYTMENVDAATVTAEVLESQRVRLDSLGFTVGSVTPVGSCSVHADPEALKQLMLNLLSNAEKYSRGRRELSVRVERAGDEVLIHVLDRGIGVPEKERERIFREFYRVDDSLSSGVQGTGLGLTIARSIARDHGGDIACHPRDGGGSDFIVRLPAPGGEDGS